MNKQPLVSVKMLAYNHEKYIGQAIESVLEQKTDFQFELIIGEDCSTDGTREIVFEYQDKYPDIIRVVTSETNVGMRKNGRRVREAARGKYNAFCEGDDYWIDPFKLQKQLTIMEANPSITMCFHNVYFEYQDPPRRVKIISRQIGNRYFSIRDVIIKGGEFYKVVSALVKDSICDQLPEWRNEAPVGDWALSLQAALEGDIYYLDEIMAVYRVGTPGSWSQRMYNNPDAYKEHLFKSMRTRKMADESTCHSYQKYFGRRIGKDIKWLVLYIKLTENEFHELKKEYFKLLSTIDKLLISALDAINAQKIFLLLRKVVKTLKNCLSSIVKRMK